MRGILMIEPLYNQVIKGNKSQTRRSSGLEAVNQLVELKVDEDNHGHYKEVIVNSSDEWDLVAAGMHAMPHNQISSVLFIRKNIKRGEVTDADSVILKPRYKIGEVLYMKEPIAKALHNHLTPNGYMYKYGVPENYVANYFGRQVGFNDSVKWSNKLFMPAAAARAFIKITGIRCERLLDISDQDCIAEGIESEGEWTGLPMWKNYCKTDKSVIKNYWADATNSFLSLYKFANKVKSIDNIWIFAYEFEYLTNYQR